jgi:hypothetical protein
VTRTATFGEVPTALVVQKNTIACVNEENAQNTICGIVSTFGNREIRIKFSASEIGKVKPEMAVNWTNKLGFASALTDETFVTKEEAEAADAEAVIREEQRVQDDIKSESDANFVITQLTSHNYQQRHDLELECAVRSATEISDDLRKLHGFVGHECMEWAIYESYLQMMMTDVNGRAFWQTRPGTGRDALMGAVIDVLKKFSGDRDRVVKAVQVRCPG